MFRLFYGTHQEFVHNIKHFVILFSDVPLLYTYCCQQNHVQQVNTDVQKVFAFLKNTFATTTHMTVLTTMTNQMSCVKVSSFAPDNSEIIYSLALNLRSIRLKVF